MLSLCVMAAAAMPALGAELGTKTAESPAPAWMDNAVIYEANLRQGTPERNFKGLQKQLPRLRDLGVDIVWLMPIHPIGEEGRKGTIGSPYAIRDFRGITYVRQAVALLEAALTLPGGVYNFGSENTKNMVLTARQFAETLGITVDIQEADWARNLAMDCSKLRAQGIEPRVFRSGNCPGTDEYNAAILADYMPRVRHL